MALVSLFSAWIWLAAHSSVTNAASQYNNPPHHISEGEISNCNAINGAYAEHAIRKKAV